MRVYAVCTLTATVSLKKINESRAWIEMKDETYGYGLDTKGGFPTCTKLI